MFQPVYQQSLPAANNNSGLRIIKKLLWLVFIPILLALLGFFFKAGGIDKVPWFEWAPFVIAMFFVMGGLLFIERMEKK